MTNEVLCVVACDLLVAFDLVVIQSVDGWVVRRKNNSNMATLEHTKKLPPKLAQTDPRFFFTNLLNIGIPSAERTLMPRH